MIYCSNFSINSRPKIYNNIKNLYDKMESEKK